MVYKASLDKMSIVITIIFIGICIAVMAMPFLITHSERPFSMALSAFIGVALIASWAFHPKNYSVDENQLIIHLPILNVAIDRREIKEINELSGGVPFSVRTLGVGGVFGYFGKYFNIKLGSMTWYATRRDKGVLITKTNGKKILLTPDRAQQNL